MQYVVYTKVVKTGELDNLDLGRLGVPLDGSGIVPTGISQVLQTQEHALNEVGSNGINGIPLDQLYTYGQVLAEAGEETENVATVQRAAEVFQGILERQLVAISELENEEFDDGEITTVENPQQADKTVALAAQEGVVPTSVVETITSLLDSLNTLLELSRDDSTPLFYLNLLSLNVLKLLQTQCVSYHKFLQSITVPAIRKLVFGNSVSGIE